MGIVLTFIQQAIRQGIIILFGASGEILGEKSGSLNLGIPGIMYMGGIAGLMGGFFYEQGNPDANGWISALIAFLCAFVVAALAGLLFSFLTITLRANQNVTGLALTTFGVGFGNFFGGSLANLVGGVGQISVAKAAAAFQTPIPVLSGLGPVGQLLFSYGVLTYVGILLAIYLTWFLAKTRVGLNIRAVGENPAAADAAGINVTLYKYLSSCVGAGIAGLGGLYFVMDYSSGTWTNNGLGDRGWLAVALVIFALWKPVHAIWGSIAFGGLYLLYLYIPGLSRSMQEVFKMFPYLVTIIVLVMTSLRKKREDQPPAGLGLPYFREER